MADQLDQSVGRNQGERYSNKTCVVAVDRQFLNQLEKLSNFTFTWSGTEDDGGDVKFSNALADSILDVFFDPLKYFDDYPYYMDEDTANACCESILEPLSELGLESQSKVLKLDRRLVQIWKDVTQNGLTISNSMKRNNLYKDTTIGKETIDIVRRYLKAEKLREEAILLSDIKELPLFEETVN